MSDDDRDNELRDAFGERLTGALHLRSRADAPAVAPVVHAPACTAAGVGRCARRRAPRGRGRAHRRPLASYRAHDSPGRHDHHD